VSLSRRSPSGSRAGAGQLLDHASDGGGWYPVLRVAPLGCLVVVFALVASRTTSSLMWVAVLLACALAATAYLLGPQLVAAEVREDPRRHPRGRE
jgi:hypothetical protein